MREEKMLIKIEKQNIFQKIHNFIKNFIRKNTAVGSSNIETNNYEERNMLHEIKKTNEVLNLQKEYEKGNISEEILTDDEKGELMGLYKKQINELEESIIRYKKNLESYKIRIMEMQKEINN